MIKNILNSIAGYNPDICANRRKILMLHTMQIGKCRRCLQFIIGSIWLKLAALKLQPKIMLICCESVHIFSFLLVVFFWGGVILMIWTMCGTRGFSFAMRISAFSVACRKWNVYYMKMQRRNPTIRNLIICCLYAKEFSVIALPM